MPELGRAALIATLGLVLYAVVAGAIAAWTRRRRLAASAQNALVGAFATTLVASAVLLAALVRNDFSFVYVAQHTSRELPTGYTISAFWGGQEGSLLLWLLILTGYGAAAVFLNRRSARDLIAWVVPVLGDGDALLRVPARRRRDAVRDAGGAGRRSGPEPRACRTRT